MSTTNSDDWRPSGGGKSLVALVPDYEPGKEPSKKSLLRLGAYDPTDEANILANLPDDWKAVSHPDSKVKELVVGEDGHPFPGWLEYTDGDRTVVTCGDSWDVVAGSNKQYIRGDALIDVRGKYEVRIGSNPGKGGNPIYWTWYGEQVPIIVGGETTWRKVEMGHTSVTSFMFGDTESFFGGLKFDLTAGVYARAVIGGKAEFNAAISMSVNLGYTFEFGANYKYSFAARGDNRVAESHATKARKSIHLHVDPVGSFWEEVRGLAKRLGVGLGVATVAGAAAAATAGVGAGASEVGGDGAVPATGATLGASGVVFTTALGIAVAFHWVLKKEMVSAMKPASEIKMDEDGVIIRHNDPTGTTMQGEILAGEKDGRTGVFLQNRLGSSLQIPNVGNIELMSTNDIIIKSQPQNHQSSLELLNNGRVRIVSTHAHINGHLVQLGGNGELRIG